MRVKSPGKEEKIFDAVLDITFKDGLVGLKVASIVKMAELAQGTVYIYFKNKRELINILYKKLKKEFAKSILPKEAGDYFTTMALVWENYLNFLLTHQREVQFLEQCYRSGLLDDESKEISDSFMKEVSDFFKNGVSLKMLRETNIDLIISFFIGTAHEIISNINNGKLKYSKELVKESFNMAVLAVKK